VSWDTWEKVSPVIFFKVTETGVLSKEGGERYVAFTPVRASLGVEGHCTDRVGPAMAEFPTSTLTTRPLLASYLMMERSLMGTTTM
jgi:hypothetical protein